jgi:hypothetical protein
MTESMIAAAAQWAERDNTEDWRCVSEADPSSGAAFPRIYPLCRSEGEETCSCVPVHRTGSPSWWHDEDWLMAVDLGYDESGADDTLLVSAQMAVTEQAKKLKRQWKSALGNVEYFHSKDLWNFTSGVFTAAGLDRKQREQLLKALGKIIHRHLSLGITAKISKKLYDALTETSEFRSRWGTHYTFAVNMIMLASHLEFPLPRGPTDVNVLIEDGHRHSAQALQVVQDVKNVPVNLRYVTVLTAALGSKKHHPILQAADMLAYAEWQEITRRDSSLNPIMYRETSRYRTALIDCNEDVIKTFIRGPQEWMERRKRYWHNKKRV